MKTWITSDLHFGHKSQLFINNKKEINYGKIIDTRSNM